MNHPITPLMVVEGLGWMVAAYVVFVIVVLDQILRRMGDGGGLFYLLWSWTKDHFKGE
jgi:hypothetical protein